MQLQKLAYSVNAINPVNIYSLHNCANVKND